MNKGLLQTQDSIRKDFTCAFPGSVDYPGRLTTQENRVCEGSPQDRPFPYSERHLQCVWYDSRWRPHLESQNGETITVIEPGRWNLEAGPDFLDAVIQVGSDQRRIKGDVEVHVDPRHWEHHGHGSDPAYREVVLHLSYFEGSMLVPSLPAGTIQASLRSTLNTDPTFSFENIDVSAYPYGAVPEKSPPCAQILMTYPPENLQRFLAAAGEERLRLKTVRLAELSRSKGSEQALYEELMAALGYKHNRLPFRNLAHRAPFAELRRESDGDPFRAYAFLLGISGLIPDAPHPSWDTETRGFVRRLWDVWWKYRSALEHRIMPTDSWRNANIRPHNAPIRRLVAAACIFTRENTPLCEMKELTTLSPEQWFARTQAMFTCAQGIPFWNHRLGLGSKHHDKPIALLGKERIAAITTNVLIPFSAMVGHDIVPLLNMLPAEADNSLIRETASVLLGRDHNPAIYRHGLLQQGLLQVFHDFCLTRRTDCRNCPLPGSLEKTEGVSTGDAGAYRVRLGDAHIL